MTPHPPSGSAELDAFLAARVAMIETVQSVLAGHRPERIKEQRVVTCTKVYDDEPHEVIGTQWPGWREHVAPLIVDALFELMIPSRHVLGDSEEHRG